MKTNSLKGYLVAAALAGAFTGTGLGLSVQEAGAFEVLAYKCSTGGNDCAAGENPWCFVSCGPEGCLCKVEMEM